MRSSAAKAFAGGEQERRWLEGLLWPLVGARMGAWLERARALRPAPRAAVVEVPLLFEAGMESGFDATIAVIAQEDTRRARAATRGHALAEERASSARALLGERVPARGSARATRVLLRDRRDPTARRSRSPYRPRTATAPRPQPPGRQGPASSRGAPMRAPTSGHDGPPATYAPCSPPANALAATHRGSTTPPGAPSAPQHSITASLTVLFAVELVHHGVGREHLRPRPLPRAFRAVVFPAPMPPVSPTNGTTGCTALNSSVLGLFGASCSASASRPAGERRPQRPEPQRPEPLQPAPLRKPP